MTLLRFAASLTLALWGGMVWVRGVAAQTEGAIAGTVRDTAARRPLLGAQVLVDDRIGAVSDSLGRYRVRAVRTGWHRVAARLIGYRGVVLDSVFVRAGATVTADFMLEASAVELAPLVVSAPVDELLDPLATSSEQKISAADLRDLPVSSLEEAIALSAGTVGTSYRGGRVGEESFILDGLGIKNQLDAASGGLGLRIPPDMLAEASLVTNGFSARYGQALSGLVNVVTLDPGERWAGRTAIETDRPFGGGLDRLAVRADGPITKGGIGLVAAIDVTGRLDDDPVNAPAPDNPFDPRTQQPNLLPHNSGEQWNSAAKLVAPLSSSTVLRVFGVHSEDQRLLYDPAYKYALDFSPAQRLRGDLINGHLQFRTAATSSFPVVVDLRAGRFVREFIRGQLDGTVDYKIGALTGSRFHIVGEDVARALSQSPDPIPGLVQPGFSDASPWGVPAFFLGGGSRGDLAWNRFGETRLQLDATYGGLRRVDLFVGGQYSAQQVRTYQRVLGFMPPDDTVPAPAVSAFSPRSMSGYVEAQTRIEDIGITAGLRYDEFDSDTTEATVSRGSSRSVSPRFAVSTVLKGATFVASYGRFTQPPDYQFLVDAAFDDTTRTGRFRRGNPDLGFERATQYEFSVRVRPREAVSLRIGAYVKRLDGLVASVPLGINPDSTIFGNADAGTTRGLEILAEREIKNGFGFRVAYTLQSAKATSTDPFLLNRLIVIDPLTGDTNRPARAEFPLDFDQRHTLTVIGRGKVPEAVGPRLLGVRPIAGLEGAVILRALSGLPFSRLDTIAADSVNGGPRSVAGLPNAERLPWTTTVDLLVRRPFKLGRMMGGVYLDVRNLLNHRNIVAVRRDSGEPGANDSTIARLAEDAYAAHPEPIPYESSRYRANADLNKDGYVATREELLPMYEAAARDFSQPLFAYGPPRLVRLGFEVLF
jgi:outer membrane receptor protein involved in Fe transport